MAILTTGGFVAACSVLEEIEEANWMDRRLHEEAQQLMQQHVERQKARDRPLSSAPRFQTRLALPLPNRLTARGRLPPA